MDYFERTIINNLQSGDEEAFEYVFKKYFQMLFNYADNLLHDKFQAEEVVSNIFAKLWENRLQLKIDYSLKSYLFRSVYHNCLNQIRQVIIENKYKSYFLNYAVGQSSGTSGYPFEKLVENELTDKIDNLIKNLPEQCRIMFLLSRDEGMTHEEIATHCGVSVNTVHTQIARALKRLKEALKDYLPLFMLLVLHFS